MKSLEFPINTNHGLAEEQDEYFRAYYLKKFAKGNHPKYILHRHKAVEIYFMPDGSLLTVFYARPVNSPAVVIMQQRWRFEI